MLNRDAVVIVIPAYNHGTRISDVVRETAALGYPVIVVDDGSTDQTAETLSSIKGITVLTHPRNMGKGAALRTGFFSAKDSFDWAVTLDADGQHKAEDIENLLAVVKGEDRPIVVGSRQGMDGINVPWTSRFGRGFSNFWVWLSGGPRISDSQSGFRLYPLPEILELDVRARRFQFEVEVLVTAHRMGIPVVETPVQVIYQKGKERISHFHPWKDFLRNSATFSRLICKRIFSASWKQK
ncbi:glycosyl transferase [Desulfocapsa sulfexigens DSM 10523]|uniref:Glycosyl transferase n=1 Tax=Desulfocapsa sulfexigens (strain DSM 10523 / SB164P1) TaxID=1167006 RepID=M1NZL1_DESSD|nr:glycosyltransferase family 2 protein [Desulfocapsa sulfexigens]AGF76713.1 glycosyl transferase [Desulfocapsa sulfexigens DSM 10523]